MEPNKDREGVEEKFAAMEHTRWSKWQSYLHSKCERNTDGSLTIPAHLVVHWERQISTPYSQLTEREKESDRNEVRPYLEYCKSHEEKVRAQIREEILQMNVYTSLPYPDPEYIIGFRDAKAASANIASNKTV